MSRKLFTTIFVLAALGFATGAGQAQDQQQGPSLSEVVEAWLASPHADRSSEAFTHWNEDGEIPGNCAVCHSSEGVRDFLQSDRVTAGVIDHPVAPGLTVDCAACHTPAASTLDAVTFPSGESVAALGSSAVCVVCHQGRQSSDNVTAAVNGMDDDAVQADLGFINVHYAASAATQMGGVTRGGYQYDGKDYAGRFNHVPDLNSCSSCHSPHSLKVEIETCTTCHKGITEFRAIRTTPLDIDGDGDTTEGIADPIDTLHARLESAILGYAAEVAGAPIVYDPATFPYFFNDSDGDGAVTEGEAAFPNRYQSWTPRLLKAAYNYQFIAKDKAAFSHNPHYAIQLLYDSLENLSEKVEVDMAGFTRP